MILFLLGISVTINLLIVAIAIIFFQIKREEKKKLFHKKPIDVKFWDGRI